MKITNYMVKEIRSSKGIYIPAYAVAIYEKAGFYRIDNTYIYNKSRIKSMELIDNKLILHTLDDDVILTVIPKKVI